MKIAYLTNAHPEDRFAWSGLSYYIRRSLELAGLEVEVIGSLPFPRRFFLERVLRETGSRTGLLRRHIWTFDPRVIASYTRLIEQRLEKSDADVVFSAGTMLISQLQISRPIYFWSDATFASMVDYYFPVSKITPMTFRHGNALEQASIARAEAGFYSSDWARDSAIAVYSGYPRRFHVAPFGANLPHVPTAKEAEKFIHSRARDPFRMVFLAVEWTRKGGDLAMQLMKKLEERFFRCELAFIGCKPPSHVQIPGNVKIIGYLNKENPAHFERLHEIMMHSHLLLLPTRADCTPIVIGEANAYGVPVLSSDTGGIPSIVTEEVNGHCFPLDEQMVDRMAEWIVALAKNPERYNALAMSSRRTYDERLNWEKSARLVKSVLEKS